MDQFAFAPDVPRTLWTFELHRPVVHEHRTDGIVSTHGGRAVGSRLLQTN